MMLSIDHVPTWAEASAPNVTAIVDANGHVLSPSVPSARFR
jgi:hypothetical protein